MTISLSLDLRQFRQDFDASCQRILNTPDDANFYSLITALTANFQQHPLFKEFMSNLEEQSAQNKKTYNQHILETCENMWRSLWNLPNISWTHRKQLMHIKKSLFKQETPLYPLPIQLILQMQKIQSNLGLQITYPLPSQTLSHENKQLYMQRVAATDASFCWDRLRLLQQCGEIDEKLIQEPRLRGKWKNLRLQIWDLASDKSEKNLIMGARNSLVLKFSIPPRPSLDDILPYEYQIHRADYENHLKSWQNHVHTQMINMENKKRLTPEEEEMKKGMPQRASFAFEITAPYWRENPKSSHNKAYKHYVDNCPPGSKPLSDTQWARIIRKYKLDPRSKKEKVRGKGK